VKLSRFYELVAEEFGPGFSEVILNDTRLTEFSDKTPAELIALGEDRREVWLAICSSQQVPKDRWHGKIQTKRHAEQ
jgi:hypothetical protein